MTMPRTSPIAQPVRQWTVACRAAWFSDARCPRAVGDASGSADTGGAPGRAGFDTATRYRAASAAGLREREQLGIAERVLERVRDPDLGRAEAPGDLAEPAVLAVQRVRAAGTGEGAARVREDRWVPPGGVHPEDVLAR